MSRNLFATKLQTVNSDAQVHRPEVKVSDRKEELKAICRQLLILLGEDPDRDGLADTPRRWANWWAEFIDYEPGNLNTTFESVTTDQMVVVSGMRVWSLCEHHLLPFWCDISIGYIAEDRVLGLSKFGRVAHKFAHRLQLQEQLTHQIADEIQALTGTQHVAVFGQGQHLCMTMRGIQTPAMMTSSVTRGLFRADGPARNEFLSIVKGMQCG